MYRVFAYVVCVALALSGEGYANGGDASSLKPVMVFVKLVPNSKRSKV